LLDNLLSGQSGFSPNSHKENIMALYESVIIGRQDLTVTQLDTLIDEFITVLKSQEGDVKKREYWGLRNLAYKINKNRKGHYTMLNIDAPASAISEYERLMGLHEDIVRFLTLKIDKIDDNPSPMMNGKSDRPRSEGSEKSFKPFTGNDVN
jgi:small subunit ribosomal protein S6